MWIFTKAGLFCVGLVLLLTPATKSQKQCTFPTDEDVKNVANEIFIATAGEGAAPTVQNLLQVHFTCLATVALDMYSYATVVANFTIEDSSDSTVDEFQLECVDNRWGKLEDSFTAQGDIPEMPFTTETQLQCFRCTSTELSIPTIYDADSNCQFCASECLDIGGGFCTVSTADDCCPYFNEETGACVDDCKAIYPNFGPEDNFVCACSISCDPGYTLNTTTCTCELTDGCEAAGQPCQNGGYCTSDLLAIHGGPYYNCTCAIGGFSGQNCTVCNISCHIGYTLNTTICSCELTDGCEAAGQPCQNGGTCVSNPSTPSEGPYYNCTCANGFSGKNCTLCTISCGPGYTLNTITCSCELMDGCEAAGQPCQNGGTCTSNLSTFPYYSCQCVVGSRGQNCDIIDTTTTPPPEADNLLLIIVLAVIVGVIVVVIVAVIIVGIVLVHIHKKPQKQSDKEELLLSERDEEQPWEEIPETVEENEQPDGEVMEIMEENSEQFGEEISESEERNGKQTNEIFETEEGNDRQPIEDTSQKEVENREELTEEMSETDEGKEGQTNAIQETNEEQPSEETHETGEENNQPDGELTEIKEKNSKQFKQESPETKERNCKQTNQELSETEEGSNKQPTEDGSQTQVENGENLKEEMSKTEEGQEEQPNGETNALQEINSQQPSEEGTLEIKDENGKQPNDRSFEEKERHVEQSNEGDYATEEQQEE